MDIARIEATDAVTALLVANELPVDDLDDPAVELFGATESGHLVGLVGLQRLAGCVLLRSLAVVRDARERGLGTQLCDAALYETRVRNCREVWLLTTSATAYFSRRGFEVVPRDRVPAAVQATAQFSSLCPATAVVMRRR